MDPEGKKEGADAATADALRAELNRLTGEANKGDRKALEALRDFLDAHPEVETHVGDLGPAPKRRGSRSWRAATHCSMRRPAAPWRP